jgi:Asp-tRNA(Asn)/Glu-tRNA(Gln) amidotransferase A subunit family amidase
MTKLRDTVGPLVRSGDDLLLLDTVMTGSKYEDEVNPASIRIGVPK